MELERRLLELDRTLGALYESELARERAPRPDAGPGSPLPPRRGPGKGRPGGEDPRSGAFSCRRGPSQKPGKMGARASYSFITRAAVKFLGQLQTLTAYALGSVETSPSDPSGGAFPVPGLSPAGDFPGARQPPRRSADPGAPAAASRGARALSHAPGTTPLRKRSSRAGYRFLREGHWNLDPGAEKFQFAPQIKVTLSREAVDAARGLTGRTSPLRHAPGPPGSGGTRRPRAARRSQGPLPPPALGRRTRRAWSRRSGFSSAPCPTSLRCALWWKPWMSC